MQGPIRLDDATEPQPDLALVRPRADDYTESHPGPADVLLVLETSDSSVNYDRQVKLVLYAQAGIPEAWLLVFSGARSEWYLEVCTEPSPQGYRQWRRYDRGERVTLQGLPFISLAAEELLGPSELA